MPKCFVPIPSRSRLSHFWVTILFLELTFLVVISHRKIRQHILPVVPLDACQVLNAHWKFLNFLP